MAYTPGPVDFSPIGQLSDVYSKGLDSYREDQLREALKRVPRGPNGEPNYGAMVDAALKTGSISAIPTFGTLGTQAEHYKATREQAAASLEETKAYHRMLGDQYNRPQIVKGDADPLNPGYTPIYSVTSDKHGRIEQRLLNPQQGGQPGNPLQQPEPPRQPGNPFDQPPASINSIVPGPQGALPPQPGGPALAQAQPPGAPPSPSDQIIAQAQQAQQGAPQGMPQPGPQFAQAGGPPQLPPQPPGPAAQPQLPPWAVGAQIPAPPGPPPPQALPPVSEDSKLRYAEPLGPVNESAIAGLPQGLQNKIKAAARGEFDIRTLSTKGGYREAFTNKLYEYAPTFKAEMYASRLNTLNAFNRGPEGRTVRAVNNLTEHLETAESLMKALKNGQVPAVNAAINKFRQITGYEGDLPGNVRAAAPIIAGEMMKVIAGAGSGGVNERQENALATMSTSSSPEVALSALNTVKQLMVGQMHGLERSYEIGTRNTDFRNRLSPGARKMLDAADNPHVPSATPLPPGMPPPPSGFQLVR